MNSIIENSLKLDGFTSALSLSAISCVCNYLNNGNGINTFEIGYYKGRTTQVMLESGSKNHTIIDICNEPIPEHIGDNRVKFIKSPSRFVEPKVFDLYGQIDFMFIDGGHTKSDLWNDLSLANKLVSYSGFLLVDDIDYDYYPDLVECIHDYIRLTEDFVILTYIDRKQLLLCRKENFLENYKYCLFQLPKEMAKLLDDTILNVQPAKPDSQNYLEYPSLKIFINESLIGKTKDNVIYSGFWNNQNKSQLRCFWVPNFINEDSMNIW